MITEHEYRMSKWLEQEAVEHEKIADDLDSTYRHIRAIIINCDTANSLNQIKHQLVGLLPEVQGSEAAEVWERFGF